MNITFILFIALLFVAVMLLVWGVYVGWHTHRGPEAERIARRLRIVMGSDKTQSDVSIVKARRYSKSEEIHALLERLPGTEKLDEMLQQAGARYSVARLLVLCAIGGLLGLIFAVALHAPILFLLGSVVLVGSLPLLNLARARQARLNRFDHQLPEALDMMGRAMRAGHAFPTALKMVADEVSAPLGEEFKSAFDEVNFGISMPDALGNLARRVPSMDLQYFVVAVLIQRESGGNLTELLSSISAIIRERHKLAGQVRVLSAEGRISAWVLCMLPFGAGAAMFSLNPAMMRVLIDEEQGRTMLYGALGMMFLGVLAIRKIVRIRM